MSDDQEFTGAGMFHLTKWKSLFSFCKCICKFSYQLASCSIRIKHCIMMVMVTNFHMGTHNMYGTNVGETPETQTRTNEFQMMLGKSLVTRCNPVIRSTWKAATLFLQKMHLFYRASNFNGWLAKGIICIANTAVQITIPTISWGSW